jgi:hypothetical protein
VMQGCMLLLLVLAEVLSAGLCAAAAAHHSSCLMHLQRALCTACMLNYGCAAA